MIWIFGSSGAGKKTAILEAVNTNQKSWLRHRLNISEKETIIPVVIPPCENRLELFRHLKDAPARVIVHGQHADIYGTLEQLDVSGDECYYLMPSEAQYLRNAENRGIKRGYNEVLQDYEKWKPELEKYFESVEMICTQ